MKRNFDVFLSHNSKDKPTVRKLAEFLKEHGLSVWLDEWEMVPGRPWQDALENMIEVASSVAVLVGSEGIGPWQQTEMRAVLSEFVRRGLPVIPVLLPKAPSRVDLPLFLQNFTWVDFREGFSDAHIKKLIWGITGAKPGATEIENLREEPGYKPSTLRPKLQEVFQTVGLPRFTYVEPTIYRKFSHTIRVAGKHIVLEGPSGVGKTCLVFRVFEELGYQRESDYVYISGREPSSAERVLSLTDSSNREDRPSLVIIDDFHILASNVRRNLANQLKLLSDNIFVNQPATKCVLIGIPTASSSLLYDTVDLGPRLTTFKLEKATDRQLETLIREGEQRLSVRFRDRDVIVQESNGSFYLCQFICHEICFAENIFETQDDVAILRYRIEDVRNELIRDLEERYWQHLLRFCRGPNLKVEKGSGYVALLASLVRINKSVIHLNEILVDSGPFSQAISEILEVGEQVHTTTPDQHMQARMVHYDNSIETFSIEDPAFRYYLSRLNIIDVLQTLGLDDDDLFKHYSVATPAIPKVKKKARKSESSTREKKHGRDLVFVSYSHADTQWMERLRIHLNPLVKQGVFSMWSDALIRAGSNWKEEIDRAIGTAKVAVLLVSADYLASDFIQDTELPPLLDRAQNEGMIIIWIPINHCNYYRTPIANYQAVIDPTKPLAVLSPGMREKVLTEISNKIITALES